jgi:hypothetical protein
MGGSPAKPMTEHPDFSVVVKNRGRSPSPWKWEIYRAGRKSPVKQSEVYFSTVTEANRAGKKALSFFLSEFHDEVDMEWPTRLSRTKTGK